MLGDGSDAIFDGRRFRLQGRPMWGSGLPKRILDGAERELAHVQRPRPGPRRLVALLAGALILSGGLLGLVALGDLFRALGHLVVYLGAPPLLVLARRATTWLSPGPELVVVRSGRDPRLLFRVRRLEEHGARSVLEVEDSNGAPIGRLELDRLRARPSAFAALGGYVRLHTADGEVLQARRTSRFRPGAVIEGDDGRPAAVLGQHGGFTWDQVELTDPPPADPRLLLAAALVASP